MKENNYIDVGIGFATGRKMFKDVLASYIYHLDESEILKKQNIRLHLFVSYDLKYSKTELSDYTSINSYVLDKFASTHFIGDEDIEDAIEELVNNKIIKPQDASICFGNGYAAKRNIVLYYAIKNKMDFLMFMDDDEYPMAVTETSGSSLWSGQHIIDQHINALKFSDMTNGYHCGYISPIPCVDFDGVLTEGVFRKFIEALSNDVLNWDKVRKVMLDGGITYADKEILISKQVSLVEEIGGAKFITGGNLGLNLQRLEKVTPFFNPPGARGEDTFLSTCLSNVTVKRIPAYTFHDGFGIYNNLLKGVLPIHLKSIDPSESKIIIDRFYKACVGWVRYKPLYTYITQREKYKEIISEMKKNLSETIPAICAFFNREEFNDVLDELYKFDGLVEEHFAQFEKTKEIWVDIKKYIADEQK